ncbi:hypothetical protein MENTO_v1c05470 [Mesoplasma entomophilum]|uniref:Lipoprotein n=1 Tax=Mesoplasma entomophilum TaxID=2149 RepID=A0A3S5Y079_9MOLU|nr:BspA family leucine-rich repeat surface protein [Mesoplasma entomophilum]ATQ35682.1 hypothetical protein CS528_02830 [Mesoplasma entomophilum]ATZ19649.1 hypothetical protein MENTO_v1c05470 [Mesoplasma entomophilum]
MKKIMSFLAAVTLTANVVIAGVSCSNQNNQNNKINIQILKNDIQEILNQKNDKIWDLNELQKKIDEKYGDGEITVSLKNAKSISSLKEATFSFLACEKKYTGQIELIQKYETNEKETIEVSSTKDYIEKNILIMKPHSRWELDELQNKIDDQYGKGEITVSNSEVNKDENYIAGDKFNQTFNLKGNANSDNEFKYVGTTQIKHTFVEQEIIEREIVNKKLEEISSDYYETELAAKNAIINSVKTVSSGIEDVEFKEKNQTRAFATTEFSFSLILKNQNYILDGENNFKIKLNWDSRIEISQLDQELTTILNERKDSKWELVQLQNKIDTQYGNGEITVSPSQNLKSNNLGPQTEEFEFKGNGKFDNNFKYKNSTKLEHKFKITESIKNISSELGTILNDKSYDDKPWTISDLQNKIDIQYGNGEITVEEIKNQDTNFKASTIQNKQRINFKGNADASNDYSYTENIEIDHIWNSYKVLASDIQTATDTVKGDYETLEAAHKAIENAVLGVTGVESVNFENSNYAWTGGQVKFTIELKENYSLEGNNSFTVDIRTGENDIFDLVETIKAIQALDGKDFSDQNALQSEIDAIVKAKHKDLVATLDVQDSSTFAYDNKVVKVAISTENKDLTLTGNKEVTLNVRFGEKDTIDVDKLQAELNKAVLKDMTQQQAITNLETVKFAGVTKVSAKVKDSGNARSFDPMTFEATVTIDEANFTISKYVFEVTANRVGTKDEINYNDLKQTFENSISSGMTDKEVIGALQSIQKPHGVETILAKRKLTKGIVESVVFEIDITIDEANYIITSTHFEIKVQVDNREIIDTKELSVLLNKLSNLSFNTSSETDLEKTIEYIIRMNTSSELYNLIEFSVAEGKIKVSPRNNINYKLSDEIDVKFNGWRNNSKNQSTIYYDDRSESFVAINFDAENEPSVRDVNTDTIYQIGYNSKGQVPIMPLKIKQINNYLPSGATDLTNMFNQCSEFNQDLNSWDTSNVTSLYGTFCAASKFNGNISGWNTQAVLSMSYTFANALQFDQNISNWNTKQVTIMDHMFENANLFNQDLSSWNVYKVTNIDNFDLNTDNWKLPKPKFDNSKNIETIISDLSSLVNNAEHKNKSWTQNDLQKAVNDKYGVDKIIVSSSKNQYSSIESHEDIWTFTGQWSLTNKELEYSGSTSIKHNWIMNVVSVDEIQELLNNFLTEKTYEKDAIEKYKKFTASGVKVVSSQKVNKDDKFIKVKLELVDSSYKWNDSGFNGEFEVRSDKIIFMQYINTTRLYELYDQVVAKAFTVNSNYKFLDLTKSIAYLNLTEEEFNVIDFKLFTINNVVGIVDIKIKDEYKNYYTLSGGEKRVSYYNAEIGENGLKQDIIAEDSKGNIRVYEPTIFIENNNNNKDGLKVYQIGIDHYNGAFTIGRLPENLEKISPYLPSEITSLYSAFFNLKNFNDPNIKQWDVSRVTNMNATFGGATNFNQDISVWNTSNVNSMNNMFRDAINFNQNLGYWKVSKVKSYENFDYNTPKWVLPKPILGIHGRNH